MELQTHLHCHRPPRLRVYATGHLLSSRSVYEIDCRRRNHRIRCFLASRTSSSSRWILRAVPRAEVQSVEESTITTSETEVEQIKLPQRIIIDPTIEYDVLDPIPGKSGTLSFQCSTGKFVAERWLASANSMEQKDSLVWVLAPVALISAFAIPQWLIGTAMELLHENTIFAELVTVVASEIIFYIGLWVYLTLTDRIQRPVLQFGPKRWSLITGLTGYMFCYLVSLSLKVVLPLFVMGHAHKFIGVPAIIAMGPFVVGCFVEIWFGIVVARRRFSCWPLVPIIFEIYRLYQLCRGGFFMERLVLGMKQVQPLGGRSGHQIMSESARFEVISFLKFSFVLSLFSQLGFLMRLFPSRYVSHRY